MSDHKNDAAFSGSFDPKKKPFFSKPTEGKMPFARVRMVQSGTVEVDGNSRETFNVQDVKVFGAEPVKVLQALWDRAAAGEEVSFLATGRMESEHDDSAALVFIKDGKEQEKRGKYYLRVLVVDAKAKGSAIAEYDAPKAKKKAA